MIEKTKVEYDLLQNQRDFLKDLNIKQNIKTLESENKKMDQKLKILKIQASNLKE